MYRNSSVSLVEVSALIVPAGSIIDQDYLCGDVMICGNPGFAEDYLNFEAETFLDRFEPPANWPYAFVNTMSDLRQAKADLVSLTIRVFGDDFGTYSSGLAYEIDQAGLFDAFRYDGPSSVDNEFGRMAELARQKLTAHKSTREYFWRMQQKRYAPDLLRPLDLEESRVHLMLAYNYILDIDDYNHESDVTTEYVGQVDLNKLVMLPIASTADPE